MNRMIMQAPYYWPRSRASGAAPWTPASIPDCVCWLRADSGVYQDLAPTTPVTANGQLVGHWTNAATPTKNLAALTLGTRAAWIQSWANGQPAVQFDGATSRLQSAAWSELAQPELTMWIVFQDDATPFASNVIGGIGDTAVTSTRGMLDFLQNATGTTLRGRGNTAALSAVTLQITGLDANRAAMLRLSGSSSIKFDATNGTPASNTTATLIITGNTGQYLGGPVAGGASYPGAIAEIAWYARALSDAELTTLNNYATTRYGL